MPKVIWEIWVKGKPVPFDKTEEAIRAGGLKYLVIVMGLGLKSLSARLKEVNPAGTTPAEIRGLPLDELVMYIEAAAEGIDYLNQQTHDGIDAKLDGAIVHCDIKPDNILIVAGGRAQIADCGVAVCIKPDMRQTHAIGTPYYRPHELLNNQPSRGTDQYSLAVSYYELRTGRVPFPPEVGYGDVLIAHATGNLDFASHVLTDGERDALRRATRVNPADRFESCELFFRTLKRAVRPLLNADGDSLRIPPPKATATGVVNQPRVLPPLPSNEIVDLELPPGIRPNQPTTRVPQPDGSLVDMFFTPDGGTLRPGVSPLPQGLTPTEPGINLPPAVAPGGLIGGLTKTSDEFQIPTQLNPNGQTPINLGGLTPANFEIDLAADALNRSYPAGPQFRSLPDLPEPADVRNPGTTAVPPAEIPMAAELHDCRKEAEVAAPVAEVVVAPTDICDVLPVEPATEQEARARSTPALDLDKTPSIAAVELTTTPADSGVPVVAGDLIQEILRKKRAERDRGKELDRTPAERVTPVPPAVEAKPKSPPPPPAPEPEAEKTLPPWFKDAHGIPAKSKPSAPGLVVMANPLGLPNASELFPPSAGTWGASAPAAAAPRGRAAPEPETRTRLVNRRATVRYYARMNPDRMYPLLVILSAEEIREIVQKAVKQAASVGFQVEVDSRVEIEPVLPGCDCYPPRDFLAVAPEPVTTTFYVVPRVMGRITAARVVLRQNGVVLAEVPLDAKVSKQTLSVVFGVLGLIAPYATAGAKSAKLDPATQQAEGFTLYRTAGQWLLDNLRPDAVGLALFGMAILCYLWFRPKRRDAFWDVDGKVPAR